MTLNNGWPFEKTSIPKVQSLKIFKIMGYRLEEKSCTNKLLGDALMARIKAWPLQVTPRFMLLQGSKDIYVRRASTWGQQQGGRKEEGERM